MIRDMTDILISLLPYPVPFYRYVSDEAFPISYCSGRNGAPPTFIAGVLAPIP